MGKRGRGGRVPPVSNREGHLDLLPGHDVRGDRELRQIEVRHVQVDVVADAGVVLLVGFLHHVLGVGLQDEVVVAVGPDRVGVRPRVLNGRLAGVVPTIAEDLPVDRHVNYVAVIAVQDVVVGEVKPCR